MKTFYACACFFSFLTIIYAAGPAKSGCLEREKALALLETAEDFLSKAEDSYPSCKENSNSTDELECSGQKPLAYIEIAKKLITDVRENFPTCTGPKIIVPDVKHKDCSETLASGRNQSGVYTIWPTKSNTTGKPLQVYCDMETDNGGWTVIQRRGKFPVQQDFYQNWESYKKGFGNNTEEFWLGNENIRVLCHKGCKIRFDLQDWYGVKRFAVYKNFNLAGSNYTLHISDYTGNAGDGMKFYNQHNFSTKDKGNTGTAEKFQGGWWHGGSNQCNLNGIYQPGNRGEQNVYWYQWHGHHNLGSVEIKVKPK